MKKITQLKFLMLLSLFFLYGNTSAQTPSTGLNFDGVNDYVSTQPMSISNTGLTVEAWIKPSSFASWSRIAEQSYSSAWYFGSVSGSNDLSVFLNNVQAVTTTGSQISLGTWQHVAFVYDLATVKIYIDGVEKASAAYTGSLSSNSPVYIGKQFNSTYGFFDGTMDELRIWNTARTQAEIAANKDNALTGNEAGLVAYYTFCNGTVGANNAGLTALADQTNNGNDGTLINFDLTGATSNWTIGEIAGGCPTPLGPATGLHFDGVNDYVNSSIPDLPATFTIEAWIKPESKSNFSTIISNKTGGNPVGGYAFAINDYLGSSQQLVFESNGFSKVYSTATVTWGVWQHVAITYDGNTAKMYINGIDATATGAVSFPLSAGTNTTKIGSFFSLTGSYFKGSMDELRIWSVAKTPQEILENKDCHLPQHEAGLIAYYDFDNGVVNAYNAGLTTLADQSTNGNDGTLTNFSLTGTTSNWAEGATIAGTCRPNLCAASATFKLYGLKSFWENAGANNDDVFYQGVSQWKRMRVNVSGGVGPYTYSWSNNMGYELKNQSGNQIYLFEPLGPSWVVCEVTDVGAGCTFEAAVFVDWSDEFYCGDASNSWKLQICDGGQSACVPWNQAKAALKAGTATLGYCAPTAPINVVNPDFELVYKTGTTLLAPLFGNLVAASGASSTGLIGPTVTFPDNSTGNVFNVAGWNWTTSMGVANVDARFNDGPRNFVAIMNGASFGGGTAEKTMTQVLPTNLVQGREYKLTCDFGQRTDNSLPSNPPILRMYAGNTLLTPTIALTPAIEKGKWVTHEMYYVVNDINISGPLKIEIGLGANTNGQQLNLDHITLGEHVLVPKTNVAANNLGFTVYPNPSNGLININFTSNTEAVASIEVVDMNGRVLQSSQVQTNIGIVESYLDLNGLANGMYFVRLVTDEATSVQRVQIAK